MNYTDEQRAILAQYEEYLRTATRADWSRNPGPRALEQINDILYAGKTYKPRVNHGCQQCILGILRDAGRLYFQDLDEIAARNAEITPVKPATEKIPAKAKRAQNSKRQTAKAK